MIDLKQIPVYVLFVVAGILAGSLFFGGEKEFDSTILQENYDLKNENQKLEYETEIAKFKSKTYQHLYFLENSDSTRLDSLWTNFDF